MVQVLSVRQGDTFGAISISPTGSSPNFAGLATNLAGLSNDSYVRAIGLERRQDEFFLGGAAGGVGNNTFGLSVNTSEGAVFVFVFHTSKAGQVSVTEWTEADPRAFSKNFEKPTVNGTWAAKGGTEFSIFQRSGDPSRAPYVYNVTVSGELSPSNTAGAVAGNFRLATHHASTPNGLEISLGRFASLGGAARQHVTWTNGDHTQEKEIPTASVVASGYRLQGAARGDNLVVLDTVGAMASGAITFEHYSIGLDVGIFGGRVSETFIGALDEARPPIALS